MVVEGRNVLNHVDMEENCSGEETSGGICAGGNGRVHRQELPAISYGRKSYLVMHKSAFLHALNLWRPGPLGVDDAHRRL